MSMDRIGPPLERLTHRLAETPAEFLEEPRIGGFGTVSVAALVGDLLGGGADAGMLDRFTGSDPKADRNRMALAAIAVWLLADEWFETAAPAAGDMLALLDGTVAELAAGTAAHGFTSDPDRREELARLALKELGYRPEGESEAQATDRLSAVSGVERARLLNASREAEERARLVREALARKAAEESADKWTRE